MSVQTASYIEAIEHLPKGAILRLPHVSWEEYEQLLADLGEARIDRPEGVAQVLLRLQEVLVLLAGIAPIGLSDAESFQHRLRPAKPAPTQTHRYDWQEHDRAQKQALRRALQRPKSPEPFPH